MMHPQEAAVLTVLRQDFFELFVVRVEPGQTLQVYVLLQGGVSKPEQQKKKEKFFLINLSDSPPVLSSPAHSLLSQRLLLVDAHVEVHGLHPQQHAALDLLGQRVEHAPRQRDADVEAVAVPGDDGQHVGR